MVKPDKSVIEKIQKLLSLANSDNENEAKMATARANELIMKYNLSLQQVEDHQNEYVVEDAADTGLNLKPHQSLIADILIEFFFVRVIIKSVFVGISSGEWARRNSPRAQYKKVFQLVGTRENCKIAGYIFSYLNNSYHKLWKEYYDTHSNAEIRHKQSYYLGLTLGIKQMLEETKWKVEQETGLVLVDDPELEKFVKSHAPDNYGNESTLSIDRNIVEDGVKDGKNIRLQKPLETTKVDSGRTLSGKVK